MKPDRILDGLDAMMVCPTYGHVDPLCQKDLRVAMASCSNRGLYWVGDASPNRLVYSAARNHAANTAFTSAKTEKLDGIMWVDSDMRFDPMMMVRLLSTVKENRLDFLSGTYHYRQAPYLPVFYTYDSRQGKYRQAEDYVDDVIAPAGACGFGFVWTSVATLRAIYESRHFDRKQGWFPDTRDVGGQGEDFNFCDQARKAGIQLYVDTGVQLGHSGDGEVITREHFRKAHKVGTLPTEPLKWEWGQEPPK